METKRVYEPVPTELPKLTRPQDSLPKPPASEQMPMIDMPIPQELENQDWH